MMNHSITHIEGQSDEKQNDGLSGKMRSIIPYTDFAHAIKLHYARQSNQRDAKTNAPVRNANRPSSVKMGNP
jgi:hypothetical protein